MRSRSAVGVALVACAIGCGEIIGLGDTPPRRGGGDAGSDAELPEVDAAPDADASAEPPEVDAAPDADASDAATPPAPTSCLDVLQQQPDAATGVYLLGGDGGFEAFCDMTFADGGWTAFFVGRIGPANVFAHFETDAGYIEDICPDPASQCLRHVPASVTTANDLAATCGDAGLVFHGTSDVLGYFGQGAQLNQAGSGTEPAGWTPMPTVIATFGGASARMGSLLWSGNGSNYGWILSSNSGNPGPSPETFASSYDNEANPDAWNYCNGISYIGTDAGSMLFARLFYR